MTDRPGRESRLPAIDIVRGFVMVLMTLDHASSAFYANRALSDGASTFAPDTVLAALPFVTRWVTHLCAPTFVFLAGLSLALSVTRRRRAGVDGSHIDRDILIRGGLLIALDVAWMGWMWRLGLPIQIGVLYAIGVAMIGMIALRRLPAMVVGALGVAILVGGEAVIALVDPTTTLAAASLVGGQVGHVYYLYPFLPWTGFLLIGWAVGARLAHRIPPIPRCAGPEPRPSSPEGPSFRASLGLGRPGLGMRARDWLALAALCALVFVVVRGANGYGNAHLLRRTGEWTAWIEWLHVSKYPPALAYAALELGIAFVLLAAAWRFAPLAVGRAWRPLAVFGQTALFYYLVHAHLLKAVALASGHYRTEGLGVVYVAWLAALVALYPACRWYLGVKRRHPDSVLRFV